MSDVAFEFMEVMGSINEKHGLNLSLRIGLDSGPVIAGVIGTKRFSYDLWGETVNMASRMESSGIPNRIQITAATLQRLSGQYVTEKRGTTEVKGVGPVTTYWLVNKSHRLRKLA